MRKSFSPDFMAKVALAAIKSDKTIAELSSKYEVHRSQISNWRNRAMDGRGRFFDNIFTERLWRTVKYEKVYIKGYQIPADAQAELGEYFPFYNDRRYHQALAYKTPHEVHYGPHERD